MSTKDIDTQRSSSPWRVFKDVSAQNAKNRNTYTAKQQAAADTFADCLKMAFAGETYINYRNKFIAVKIERPITKDKFYKAMIEGIVKDRNYDVRRSAQGVIYRIPR